jgi:hypothetical protein
MKIKYSITSLILIFSIMCLWDLYLKAEEEWNMREFMERKLIYSQKILEGLCTENFGLIKNNAEKLRVMLDDKHFPDYKKETYNAYRAKFQKNATTLHDAATNRDLDGASRAYHQVTASCIECHRWVRGQDLSKNVPLSSEEVKAYLSQARASR